MPLMEVTITQKYAEQEIINRWNYLATGTPAAASFSLAMCYAMGGIEDGGSYPAGTVCVTLAAIQAQAVEFVEISARDVYSVTDFYTNPFSPALVGGQVAAGLSPATAYGFRTNRTRLDIRRGTKRFVGVTETQQFAAGQIEASFVASGLTNLATAMSAVLTYDDEGNTLTFTPVIVGKEKYQSNSNPVRYAYKYYDDEEDQLDHLMSSIIWSPYDTTRTQVSRQYGRGR